MLGKFDVEALLSAFIWFLHGVELNKSREKTSVFTVECRRLNNIWALHICSSMNWTVGVLCEYFTLKLDSQGKSSYSHLRIFLFQIKYTLSALFTHNRKCTNPSSSIKLTKFSGNSFPIVVCTTRKSLIDYQTNTFDWN